MIEMKMVENGQKWSKMVILAANEREKLLVVTG